MAEPLGLAASLVSLASLFSTCIECFEYYCAAKECPKQLKTKLVKLDFEKTRLLIWANEVGLVSTDIKSRHPGLTRHEEQLRAGLEQIQALLADANKMQEYYGLRMHKVSTGSEEAALDLVSRNSFNVFKTSYRRFCGKFANPEVQSKLSARIRWAISDKAKFENLILDLKNFVDNLFLLIPVDRTIQDKLVEADIMAIGDLLDLQIVQEASEDSYKIWNEAASRAVDRTDKGTVTDVEVKEVSATRSNSEAFGGSSLPFSTQQTRHTNGLLLHRVNITISERKSLSLGVGYFDLSHHDWTSAGRHSLGMRLALHFNVGKWSRDDVFDHMRRLAQNTPNETSTVATAYVYVAPCARLIEQALCVCEEIREAKLFESYVRVDDRLSTTCCASAETAKERHAAMVKLIPSRKATVHEVSSKTDEINEVERFLNYFDVMWLEQRLHALMEEEHLYKDPHSRQYDLAFVLSHGSYSQLETIAGVVIIGEEEVLRPFMTSSPFPIHAHVPSATEIYAMVGSRRHFNRRFLGKFTPSGYVLVEKGEPAPRNPTGRTSLLTRASANEDVIASSEPSAKRPKISAPGNSSDYVEEKDSDEASGSPKADTTSFAEEDHKFGEAPPSASPMKQYGARLTTVAS